MNRHDLLISINVALAEVLQREITGLAEETRLFEDLDLDSTTVIELLMALEDVCGVELDPETLGPEHFATVGSLADYLLDAAPAETAA